MFVVFVHNIIIIIITAVSHSVVVSRRMYECEKIRTLLDVSPVDGPSSANASRLSGGESVEISSEMSAILIV